MSAERGKLIYAVRCASCHGIQGTGDGPAAPGMRVAPPDLTKISERAGGAFPSPRIIEVIMYGGNIAAHGSETMPVWGRVFSDEGGRGRAGGLHSRRAVLALKRYLETIQK
jgi:mono/diheme cytochrome c family protein